jgi:DnaK suppressor protein
MNATVTKSAKKSAPAATRTGKETVKTTAVAKGGSASRSAGNSVKSATATAKSSSKSAAGITTAVAKSAKVTAKNIVPVATSPAPKTIAKAAARPVVKTTTVKKAVAGAAKSSAAKGAVRKAPGMEASLKQRGNTKATVRDAVMSAAPTKAGVPQEVDSNVSRSGEPVDGRDEHIGSVDENVQTVVSKVSKVATKTTKSTPVADGALLTEEQILNMSDKDYMNEAQLAFFKARLQQLEKDLLKNADETTEHLRETVLVPDPADRATIEEEHALELRTRDRERKLLKKVQQSLTSIESGEYGWCEETGEPIGIPRLLARPTATLSLEAQQRRELKQKLYGD